MIRFEVRNDCDSNRLWQLEPWGEEVLLAPKDVLSYEVEHTTDVDVQIYIHDDRHAVWTTVDGKTGGGFVDALKLNGKDLWPA
jgi:hypothetical protein